MPKQWTVLVYMGADDKPDSHLPEHGHESLRQICEVGSSAEVNIVAQADVTGEPTRLYYFTRGAALEDCVLNPSNPYNWDSGESQNLMQFLRWGMSAYPAHRYLVILWGHGTGLDEACYWQPPYYVAAPPERTLASVERIGNIPRHESKGLFDEWNSCCRTTLHTRRCGTRSGKGVQRPESRQGREARDSRDRCLRHEHGRGLV